MSRYKNMREMLSNLWDNSRYFVSDVFYYAKNPLLVLGGSVIANWITPLVQSMFGQGFSTVQQILIPGIIASTILYGIFKAVKRGMYYEPYNLSAVKLHSNYMVSQGALFSAIIALSFWCKGNLIDLPSTVQTTGILFSTIPFLQGVIGEHVIKYRLEDMFEIVPKILDDIVSRGPLRIRITQKMVDEVMRATYEETKDMDEDTRQRFVAQNMKEWAKDREMLGDKVQVEGGEDSNNLILYVQPATA